MDEPLEVEGRQPAELGACLGRIADEVVQLRLPTHERLVDRDVLLPVEADACESRRRRAHATLWVTPLAMT